ncbi:unnamed protein product [Phytophthora fragariaefolia]|uniref:Unnamed protein product n=1 Tax=Phytophthora fragariaefolia TaxID=1490495 RepID=A0A9W6TWH3_9STRA|nr:unnamed protein product [Phytophthora fragariaefolia]
MEYSYKVFRCTHGCRQKSRTKGQRSTPTRFTGYKARFTAAVKNVAAEGVNADWKIVLHSHYIEDYLADALERQVTPQQARNIVQKVLKNTSAEKQLMSMLDALHENDGHDVLVIRDQNDVTFGVVMQTAVQKIAFQQWGDTLCMDWTYGTNNLGFHLGRHISDKGAIPEIRAPDTIRAPAPNEPRPPDTIPAFLQKVSTQLSNDSFANVSAQWDLFMVNEKEATCVQNLPSRSECKVLLPGNAWTVDTRDWSCTCMFYKSRRLPCQHIMMVTRKAHGLKALPTSTVPIRWSMKDTGTLACNLENSLVPLRNVINMVKARQSFVRVPQSSSAHLNASIVPDQRTSRRPIKYVRLNRKEQANMIVLSDAEKYARAQALDYADVMAEMEADPELAMEGHSISGMVRTRSLTNGVKDYASQSDGSDVPPTQASAKIAVEKSEDKAEVTEMTEKFKTLKGCCLAMMMLFSRIVVQFFPLQNEQLLRPKTANQNVSSRYPVVKQELRFVQAHHVEPFSLETKTNGLLHSEAAKVHEALADDVVKKYSMLSLMTELKTKSGRSLVKFRDVVSGVLRCGMLNDAAIDMGVTMIAESVQGCVAFSSLSMVVG